MRRLPTALYALAVITPFAAVSAFAHHSVAMFDATKEILIEGTVSDDGLLGGWTHNARLAWRWRFIDDGLTDADRRMIAGMTRGAAASGASLPYDDLVRDQAVVDVGVPSRTSGELDQHRLAHSLTVVASQAQAPARVWVGRTFSLSGLASTAARSSRSVYCVDSIGL